MTVNSLSDFYGGRLERFFEKKIIKTGFNQVTRYREIRSLKNSEVNKQRRDKLGSVCFHLYFTVKTPPETIGAVGHWTL